MNLYINECSFNLHEHGVLEIVIKTHDPVRIKMEEPDKNYSSNVIDLFCLSTFSCMVSLLLFSGRYEIDLFCSVRSD